MCLAALVLGFIPLGDVRVSTAAELRAALRDAKPGTCVLLSPGDYEGFSAEHIRGSTDKPIELRSADPKQPAVFTGGLHLQAPQHLVLADFEIRGASANGLNIDDGGALDHSAHHLVLRGLAVRDCGRNGNEDGIKLSGVADFRLEACTVERWGRGGSAVDMVGCRDGLLLDCTVRDRDENAAATGVQLKGGTHDVTLRDCTFVDAGQRAVNIGGSTGLAFFRPKPAGFEARAITVEGCTFTGSLAPLAFVGVDGATVRFNTFVRPRKWLARILQETREPGFVPSRKGVFTDNLIVYRSDELRTAVNVGDATAPETFEFARNWWHCEDAPSRPAPALPTPEKDGLSGAAPLFVDLAAGNYRQSPKSPALKFGAFARPGRER
jgi:hypothetical protein